MNSFLNKINFPLKIALIYLFIGVILAIGSEPILFFFFNNEKISLVFHSYKEIFFIVVTSILIYLVVKLNLDNKLKSEKALTESERKYREIVQNANSAIIKFDLSGKIQFFNEYAENLYGFKAEEIIGRNIYEFIQPYKNYYSKLSNELFLKKISQSIKSEHYIENWTYTKDHKRLYLGWTNKPIYDHQNNLVGIISIGADLTEQKIMTTRIVESEKKLKQIFNLVSDGIIIITFDGKILEQNDTILNALGLTKADIVANDTNQQIFLKLIPGIEQKIGEVIKKGEVIFDTEFTTSKGEKMALEVRATRIKYQGQDAIIAIGRNVLAKKIDQQKVYNAALFAEEKERSRVAKELHDSISPLLSTIKLYIQTLRECKVENMKNQIMEKTEETINDCIQSITEISNNLSPHILENFGLFEAINSYTEKISDSYQIAINVKSNTNERLKENLEVTIYRVITELINNTVKYAHANKIDIAFQRNSEFFIINYNDNGIGFDLDEVKQKSKGMGLYNITNRVKSLSGSLNILTKPENGVHVTLKLPIKPYG